MRQATTLMLAVIGAAIIWSAVGAHRDLVQTSLGRDRERLDRLWAARDRVVQVHGAYLIENGNALIGAWLAYFARGAAVYYDLPDLADSRIPTEAVPFRKIPAAANLTWLDLDQTGPVVGHEPSPQVRVVGGRSTFRQSQRTVQVLGPKVDFEITRADGFAPPEREYALEFGLTLLPGAQTFAPVMTDARGKVLAVPAPGAARRYSVRVRLAPGVNRFQLQVQPAGAADRDVALLQALSLERAEALVR